MGVWMHAFTAVVVIGLIIEYRDPFIDAWNTGDFGYITKAIGHSGDIAD